MAEALKNIFNKKSVGNLAGVIFSTFPEFDQDEFLESVFDGDWNARELKQRIRHITLCLGEGLPQDYLAALEILIAVFPKLKWKGFERMVFPDFVEAFGLDHWTASIDALEYFTKDISGEFAIRPFIIREPQRTMEKLLAWTRHPHAGVRRLASEGCRPRLPWGVRLSALVTDPAPILPILENLKEDEDESVRRSVANNLNDISKDNPEVVIRTLTRWQKVGSPKLDKVTAHALRTLLKKGDPDALALMGYTPEPKVRVRSLTIEPWVDLGQDISFSFEIESLSNRAQNIMVDYVMHFLRTNGKHNKKVFKLSKKKLAPGETIRIIKHHSFRPVRTRKYYPGAHALEPKINGKIFGKVEFWVK